MAAPTGLALSAPIDPDQSGDGHLALIHRKVNQGRLLPTVGVRVAHADDSVTFSREEVEDEGLVKTLSNATRIERALRGGAASAADLAQETGISDGVIRVTLARGKDRMFIRLADGRWGLAQTSAAVRA